MANVRANRGIVYALFEPYQRPNTQQSELKFMTELTILMPCLNEAETLETCIVKALDYLKRSGVDGEVLIADNGSTDGSQEIAKGMGARVVDVPIKGYGAALSAGIAGAKGRAMGQETKMEMIYDYLTGTQFKQRVDAIVERFEDMQDNLRKERVFIEKQWALRAKQIDLVIASTVGMHGDLQGIAGRSMPEIESLDALMIGKDDD